MNSIIESDPSGYYAPKALRQIYYCYSSGELDFPELRQQFGSLAQDWEGEYPELAWEARRLTYQCLAAEGDLDAAIETGSAMLDDAPTELGAIYAKLDVLRMEEDRDGGDLDAVESIAERICQLESSIDAAAQRDYSVTHKPPSEFALSEPFPNPFNSATLLSYSLPVAGNLTINIYDLSGREVENLVTGYLPAGRHDVVWNAADRPSGVYICRLETHKFSKAVKLALIR